MSSDEERNEEEQEEESLQEEIDQPFRDQINVGKSLRNDAAVFGAGRGALSTKTSIFNESFQLPLGSSHGKRSRLTKDFDDHVDFHDPFLGEEDVVMMQSSSINAQHVRTQRRNEADLLGIRIRLQPLVDISFQLNDCGPAAVVSSYQSLLKNLISYRKALFSQGSLLGLDKDVEPNWDAIHALDQTLLKHHEKVISSAEMRTSLIQKKKLKTLNSSIFEQVDSSLARQREINPNPDTEAEEKSFYSQMLRDFVLVRSAVGSESHENTKKKIKTKKSREEQANYTVHEKLVNFMAPKTLSLPSVDVDQLVKSLFA